MRTRMILGPAGGGKTFRCLAEIRAALAASPDGPPLLLIAPKQTTYQLERQLLADPSLPGYTRLHILSFERLAFFVFTQLGKTPPLMLDEEGRVMVLRGLLSRKRAKLKLFRASARLAGFAQQLSLALRELQRQQLTPESLAELAAQPGVGDGLASKLHDLAMLLRDYLDWLRERQLEDAERLLDLATETLRAPHPPLALGGLWVDGFTELSPQEVGLLAEIWPAALEATITFCLDHVPTERISWLSHWSSVRQAYHRCRDKLELLPGCHISTELLPRRADAGRFAGNPPLQHLEANWAEPRPFKQPAAAAFSLPSSSPAEAGPSPDDGGVGRGSGRESPDHFGHENPESAISAPSPLPPREGRGPGRGEGSWRGVVSGRPSPIPLIEDALRIAACADPEAEVAFAAREILRFARTGGRYREITVLARRLEDYHAPIANIFARYDIPFFLDRREAVSHHPLAELTRNAVRTLAHGWAQDDWFAALKTGLLPALDEDIDRLENEALARGWNRAVWQQPIAMPDDPETERRLEQLRRQVVPPFNRLALGLAQNGGKPDGAQLAAALREFWQTLNVEDTLREWSNAGGEPHPIHLTVWDQMNAWLDNLDLAFPDEALPLRDWLPILEAGLAGISVGVIPPALDQVLVGAIDRSRNPDIRLALVLGMNETVFPALPEPSVLLSETDRTELEERGVSLANIRQLLGRERFHCYAACTRARERLVLTYSTADANGDPLNPSPFLAHVKRLFPTLEFETAPPKPGWRESEHANELVAPLLRHQLPARDNSAAREFFDDLPALVSLRERLRHLVTVSPKEQLPPELAAQIYGPALRTSVSRMEQFAACPFKFFVHSGLRAEERKLFELDVRNQGSFQHDVLAAFHDQLRAEDKRWRDLTPAEGRERVRVIAAGMALSFRDGLLQANEESRFTARMLTESLQDFVETLTGWMRQQYAFDPAAVELGFGEEGSPFPAWNIDLGEGHQLLLHGRIDRVDLWRCDDGSALCVVVDYKSSQKQLDPLLMTHGLQLQLPAYLSVLRHWPNPAALFGVAPLVPAGVFYVSLRGKYDRSANRDEALAGAGSARQSAYQHTGRFDAQHLRKLDTRPDATRGDQFKYALKKDGSISQTSREALESAEFMALLDAVEGNLKRMGRAIYAGETSVDPYRKGTTLACDQCDYRAICRIDPWTHVYRLLRKAEAEEDYGDSIGQDPSVTKEPTHKSTATAAIPPSPPRRGRGSG